MFLCIEICINAETMFELLELSKDIITLIGYESINKMIYDIWLNPKYYSNEKSAGNKKLQRLSERSTHIMWK